MMMIDDERRPALPAKSDQATLTRMSTPTPSFVRHVCSYAPGVDASRDITMNSHDRWPPYSSSGLRTLFVVPSTTGTM